MAAGVKADDIAPYVYPANASASPAAMTYLNDGKTYVSLSDDATKIVKYDIKSGQETGVLLDVNTARDSRIKTIGGYIISPDESYILVYESKQSIYRRSFLAKYYVYEVRHNVMTPLSTDHPLQRVPQWSPDGRMIAYVADNNIYIRKLDYNTEVAVTKDGEINKVINGVPDWVYEEEFDTTSSMSWAPDNLTFCYLKYNETDVPMYSFTLYEGTCDPKTEYALYPGSYSYKYPVAGKPNSKVTLHSYDIETRKTKDITLSDSRIEYIPRIAYADAPERLIVTTLNRAQNRMEVYSVNPKSTVAKSIYVDEAQKGWVTTLAYENMKLYPDFFVVSSERSGYNQLYQYSYSGSLMRQLTSGDYDVTAYYGYNKLTGTHYYQSTSNGAINRVVSGVDAKGKVTNLGETDGTSNAVFSPDMAYLTYSFSNTTTPPKYSFMTSAGKVMRVLEDNAAVAQRYANAPTKEFFTIKSDGYELNASIIKPRNFNPQQRYPVIMSQYSGPGSQEVLNKWSIDWAQFYAQQGYIVISVDGRGTGGRGRDFKTCVYRNLGHYETIDQVNAAKYAASLPYVSKVGIYGWSYGGYEALMAASAYKYAAAVAVAPVTSWRYYDTIYTERYMLTPQENEDGYNESAPINQVDKIETPLLIMHGTADDNVHLMNTIQYVSALESQGKVCDMLLFPNMNHSIYGCDSRALVYLKMLNFFDSKMK
jgi:dipeptidyl-peptidase-4